MWVIPWIYEELPCLRPATAVPQHGDGPSDAATVNHKTSIGILWRLNASMTTQACQGWS